MAFSSAVILTDLNDFIAPSQACIKPVESTKVEGSSTTVKMDSNGEYYQVDLDGTESKLQPASITLNDCLACSGCITSAESVLITMQSQNELYKVLEQNQATKTKIVVISISSQVRASFGAKYGYSQQRVWTKLQFFFKSILKVDYVFDIDVARDISLIETAHEFVDKFTNQKTLPVLASSCPGFICYAEKTHGEILPFIDSTKSPQQIMGSLVKDYLAKKLSVTPDQIYHVSIMPCYDKKLEASRNDFYNEIYSVREVDLVLSATEIESMMVEKELTVDMLEELPTGSELMKGDGINLYPSEGSSSGGYLSFIMRFAVFKLYGINISYTDIENGTNGITISPGRNPDFKTVSYTPPGQSEPTLTFAYSYGFRNIQNIVRKLKPKKGSRAKPVEYQFIEVMACPSGCANGGGQLKPQPGVNDKEHLEVVQKTYRESGYDVHGPENSDIVQHLYEDWLGGRDSVLAKQMLHTQYHAVEQTIPNGLAVKW